MEYAKKIGLGCYVSNCKKIEINVVLHRLGYLLDVLNMKEHLSRKIKAEIIPYQYSFFDPTAVKTRILYSKEMD